MSAVTTQGLRKAAVGTAVLVVMCFVAGISSSGNEGKTFPLRVEKISGNVYISDSCEKAGDSTAGGEGSGEEKWSELLRMKGVEEGNCVFTGPDSNVSLKCWKNNARITLDADSMVEIRSLSEEERDGEDTAVIGLVLYRGSMDITAGEIGGFRMPTEFDVSLGNPNTGQYFEVTVDYDLETGGKKDITEKGDVKITTDDQYDSVTVWFKEKTVGHVSFLRKESEEGGDILAMTIYMKKEDTEASDAGE